MTVHRIDKKVQVLVENSLWEEQGSSASALKQVSKGGEECKGGSRYLIITITIAKCLQKRMSQFVELLDFCFLSITLHLQKRDYFNVGF
jgi:hypothetical protein